MEPGQRGLDCCLEILGEATGSVDPTKSSLDHPSLGKYDEALDLLVCSFRHGNRDTAGFESGALRLVASVAAIDERDFDPKETLTQGLLA